MVWARIDDEILDNAKIAKAGVFGFAMQVAGIAWCCRNLSDGHIPYARVTALLTLTSVEFDRANPLALPGGPKSMAGDTGLDPYIVADHLVDVGLWSRTEHGYEIHDFLEYNPSRADVIAERERARKRVEKHRKSRGGNGGGNGGRNGVSNGDVADGPVPVPVPKEEDPPTPFSDIRIKAAHWLSRVEQYGLSKGRNTAELELGGDPVTWPEVIAACDAFAENYDRRDDPKNGSDSRASVILGRFAEGYSVSDIGEAFRGSKLDEHIAKNRAFQTIKTILRDAAQVDKFRSLLVGSKSKAPTAKSEGIVIYPGSRGTA